MGVFIGNTDGSGNIATVVPGHVFAVGQSFVIADEIFTVYQMGTPAAMLDTGSATSATFNTTNGLVVITGATATTPVWWYPGQPVMGLCNYDVGPINDQPSYGFDTQFAYLWTSAGWIRSGTGTSPIWHGTNRNFFWTYNWRGSTVVDGLLAVVVAADGKTG